MKNLIDALEKFISLVNPEETYFMSNYNLCVIGKTVGWNSDFEFTNEIEIDILKTHFGIVVNSKSDAGYFSQFASNRYSETEWKVIRLFTSAVYEDVPCFDDDYIDNIYGDVWLKIANEVLAELKEQNV